MPELIEVELYRRTASRTIGRTIAAIELLDPFGLRNGTGRTTAAGLEAALVGATVVAARRIGKLLLLDLAVSDGQVGSDGSTTDVLGLRFGMTGRLVVDGTADIDELLYSSSRDDAAWDRFRVRFDDGGTMAVNDPRRLGGVELDPDVNVLGPDATTITLAEVRAALSRSAGAARSTCPVRAVRPVRPVGSAGPAVSTAAVKARIMDQHRIAGIGNLLADEILWRAGIAPGVAASSLSGARIERLHAAILSTVSELTERGGSHLGDVMEARHPGGLCPRDGAAMRVAQVGGRTSWWCPKHQR